MNSHGNKFFAHLASLALWATASMAGAVCAAQTSFAQAPLAPGYSVISQFQPGSNTQPSQPSAMALIQGRNGALYTTTASGGGYYGTVFSMTPGGVSAIVNGIGDFPSGGVTLGTDGNLYTTNTDGGSGGNGCGFAGCGQIIKVSPAGVATVLYNFLGYNDGGVPLAAPIEGPDGNFYGSTSAHGANGLGTLYRITPGGVFSTIYTFSGPDGGDVSAPLIVGTDGNFYGDSNQGGTNNLGVVFKFTSTGVLTVLHSFTGSPDGAVAPYGLVQANDGNFYGVTSDGGTFYGTVFQITPGGAYNVIYTFTGGSDGKTPGASLIQATDGNLYSVANGGGADSYGTIYSVTTGGAFTLLYTFDSTTGAGPAMPLLQHTDGVLYGMTSNGGTISGCNTYGCGVFFALNQGLKPFATLVTPTGKEGSVAQILGQGFNHNTIVSFNGTRATIVAGNPTALGVTVPAGATTGPVTVTTGSTTLTSSQPFRVKPVVTSFSPPSGPVGTSVTINGTGLSQTTQVTFGGVPATTFTVDSDLKVTATVPSGAKTGKIAIQTPGGIATSSTNFVVN